MYTNKRCVIAAGTFFFLCVFTTAGLSESGGEDQPDVVKPDLNYAQVVYVKATQGVDGSWCIHATVRHNDEGWDHYANAWQVLDEEGRELAWRMLAHPHDDEQPFERSKCDVNIPPGVGRLIVQAKCSIHGFGGQSVTVDLSVPAGEKFKVRRPGP